MLREYKPRGLYEITVTTIADAAVIYKERRIRLTTDAFVAKTETHINLFVIFAGIAVLMMLVSNIFFWRGSFAFAFAFAFAAFAFAFAFAAFAAFAFAFAAAFAAAFAFAFAAVTLEKSAYRVASGVFYAFIALSVIVFYL